MNTPTILVVPGLRDHVSDHWQTLLCEKLPSAQAVLPLECDKLSCAARVDAIERALVQIDGPVILVAHSAGAMMVVHWARTSQRPIQGALLAAPADLETQMPPGYPTMEMLREHGWLPVPRVPLPFPSIVAASTNDPLAHIQRLEGFAKDWGSRFVNIGAVGHLNPASGYGKWDQAEQFIRMLS